MQPENSLNNTPGIEQAPAAPIISPESVPSLPPVHKAFEQQPQVEQAAEAGAHIADASAQAAAVAGTMAQQAPSQSVNPMAQSNVATPLVAADDDVIEKEWVDKAKEIIEQTRDDPHKRTEKVNELQREYLSKRYGKVVGATE